MDFMGYLAGYSRLRALLYAQMDTDILSPGIPLAGMSVPLRHITQPF